jgi:GNAT superfamily N-acetyltransferase/RimJ/RimL family protein N-acetyltransferase
MNVTREDGRALDQATADGLAHVDNAAQALDAPHLAPTSGEHTRLRLKHGWDNRGTRDVIIGRSSGGDIAAFAEVVLPHWDNRHLAFAGMLVHPDHRNTPIAEAILDEVYAVMKEDERTVLVADAWADSPLESFWTGHGLDIAMCAAQRRLLPGDLDWAGLDELHQASVEASAEYDVIEIPSPAPPDLIDPLLDLQRTMNDAPIGDLALEDDEWSEERYRSYEQAMHHRHIRLIRLVARRRSDGELGGFTVVAIEAGRPHLGFQEDTAVVGAHRGRRLGLRMKIEMLRLLAEREPQVEQIDTWNADSNAHMIAVNEAIGCVVVGRGVEVQRKLP